MTAQTCIKLGDIKEAPVPSVILVADDDPATRILVRSVLEEDGYIVVEAADGTEVLELYRQHSPNMILMDAIMPTMDGFEACVRLHEEYGSDCAPVLTVTGLNDENSVERAFVAGTSDFITKPIHWPVLLHRVRRIINAVQADKLLTMERQRAEEERIKFDHQFRHAHKMEAIGQLAGGIAHDFNNILASIVGYTDLSIESIDDRQGAIMNYLKEINRAAERARNLINQMLIFSRNDEIEDKRELINVELIVKEVLKLLRPTLPAGIKVKQYFESDLPQIYIDPVHLHQIIMNMGINARDAMDGKGEILISVHKVSCINKECSSCHKGFSGDYLELVIQDDGYGIDKEKLSRVFDPFFTTKEVGRGTGMGLAVVHGIVHQCGGHIVVDSMPQGGSRFSLFFPFAEAGVTDINPGNVVKGGPQEGAE